MATRTGAPAASSVAGLMALFEGSNAAGQGGHQQLLRGRARGVASFRTRSRGEGPPGARRRAELREVRQSSQEALAEAAIAMAMADHMSSVADHMLDWQRDWERRQNAQHGSPVVSDGERLLMWEAARQDLQALLQSADARLAREQPDAVGGKALLSTFPAVRVEPDTVCAICIDEAAGDSTELWRRVPCGHAFHEACLSELVQLPHRRSCPLCRLDLTSSGGSGAGRAGTPDGAQPRTRLEQEAASPGAARAPQGAGARDGGSSSSGTRPLATEEPAALAAA